MIRSIQIRGFKSLEKVDVELGSLNIFIGANASGKSNFFDALRVLQGIGYGFTIGEILDGKPKSASSEVWDAIRGGKRASGVLEREHGAGDSLRRRTRVRRTTPRTLRDPLRAAVGLAEQ
jgi:DNA repair ATPase RecN